MNRPLSFSFFESSKHSQPSDTLNLLWEDFASGLVEDGHAARPDKDGEAIIFGRVEMGRKNSDVCWRDGTALDFDHLTRQDKIAADAVVARLEEMGIAFVLYSTHSWTAEDPRFRVVIPFDRRVESNDEWQKAMRGLQSFVGRRPSDPTKWLNDASTCSYSRLFFLPSSPTGKGEIRAVNGQPMAVEWLLGLAGSSKGTTQIYPLKNLSREDFGEIGRRLRQLKNVTSKKTGELINEAFWGKPLSLRVGERNTQLYVAMGALARRNGDLTPESVGAFFGPSLLAMRAENPDDPPPDEAAIADMYRRQVKELQTQETATSPELPSVLKYSPEELASIHQAQHNDNPPWLLSKGRKNWFLTLKGYQGPFDSEQFHHVARFLAKAPLDLYVQTKEGGWRLRKYAEFAEWDQVIDTFTASFNEPVNRFDPETRTFVEAVGLRGELKSKEWPEINEWLKALGGENSERLLDWVAAVAMQDKTSAILYLEGPPRSGKTLLAQGLAKIWRHGSPVPFASFASDFNSLVEKCPLILADEGVSGKNVANLLREFCSAEALTLRRKNLPDATIVGNPRLIITANNPDILNIKSAHTLDDQEALAQRFLYIKVDKEAGCLLPGGTEWLDHKIAEHALWLAETREIKPGTRFFIDGGGRSLLDHIAIAGDSTAQVLELILNWLSHNRCRDGWRIVEDELWVSTMHVAEEFASKGMRMVPRDIGRALGSIAGNRKQFRVNGKLMPFKRLDLARMKAWLERDGFMGWDEFTRILAEGPGKSDKQN